jgi:transcriptional regulator with XRE-family HTH domain
MTGLGLALENKSRGCHDSGTVLTEGERIAWRRDRLGWNQRELARRAGVGLATVTRIEKDRNVQQNTLRSVLGALDAGEKARPDLLGHSEAVPSEPSMKEGADALTRLQRADARLARIELFLAETLEDVRRARADIADDRPESQRKRG